MTHPTLNPSQLAAIEHFRSWARDRSAPAKATIDQILRMSNVESDRFDEAVAALKRHARVALHFHPDRPVPALGMRTVAKSLLNSGVYKSQFETQISNGSVSAHSGGERDLWEKTLYGSAYHSGEIGTTAEAKRDRPRYGALDLFRHSDGPAPNFGSCYFILKPTVSERCTFTYLDSHLLPDARGTLDLLEPVIAALLYETFTRDYTLGRSVTVPKLVNHLARNLAHPYPAPGSIPPSRNLNHYIEAQIHGEILLSRDVEALVADPSFKGAETGRDLEELRAKYGIELDWHPGFILSAADVPSDFRGKAMPSLAKRVAQFGSQSGPKKGKLSALEIGRAVQDLRSNPETWAERGPPKEVLQELKLLWQVLVRFGQPVEA